MKPPAMFDWFKKDIKSDNDIKFIYTAFKRKENTSYGSPWDSTIRKWTTWEQIKSSNRSVVINEDGKTLIECLEDDKVVWIDKKDLKWPINEEF